MPGTITTPRFTRMLQRLFAAKGGEQGVLIDDVMPVAEVMDTAQSDLLALRGEFIFGQNTGIGAVAAQYGSCYISNPPVGLQYPGSSHLFTVQTFVISNADAAPQTYGWALISGISASGAAAKPRDSRLLLPGGTSPNAVAAVGASTSAAAPPSDSGSVIIPANSSFMLPADIDFVLGPGSTLFVSCLTVNKAVNMTFYWSERQAELEELVRIRI